MKLVAGQKCSQAKAIIFILTVIMLHVTKQQLVMILSIRCHGVNYKHGNQSHKLFTKVFCGIIEICESNA